MTKSSSPFHAVVVGGGLVGKSAALAMSQAGMRVGLLAPPAAPLPSDQLFDQRVYALSASSQALMERMRVWQALDASKINPVFDMQVRGDAFAKIHFSAFQASVPQLAWIAESRLIEAALDVALRFQPHLDWQHARAQGLEIGGDGTNGSHGSHGAAGRPGSSRDQGSSLARLTLDDGRQMQTELVVGADGAHSWVRSQMGAEVKRRAYGQTGVVANFKISKPHAETAWQWFRDGEIIALLPMPGPYVSLVWSATTEHAEALVADGGEKLAALLEQFAGASHGVFDCVTEPIGFPLALQSVDRLVAPRVALIGDAAHLLHPLAGQGVNLGLRDVVSLVDVLRSKETFRDYGDPILLRRYERSRREDIAALTLATDGLQRLFSMQGAVARGVRNLGMSLVGAQPFLKRWLVANALG